MDSERAPFLPFSKGAVFGFHENGRFIDPYRRKFAPEELERLLESINYIGKTIFWGDGVTDAVHLVGLQTAKEVRRVVVFIRGSPAVH